MIVYPVSKREDKAITVMEWVTLLFCYLVYYIIAAMSFAN